MRGHNHASQRPTYPLLPRASCRKCQEYILRTKLMANCVKGLPWPSWHSLTCFRGCVLGGDKLFLAFEAKSGFASLTQLQISLAYFSFLLCLNLLFKFCSAVGGSRGPSLCHYHLSILFLHFKNWTFIYNTFINKTASATCSVPLRYGICTSLFI